MSIISSKSGRQKQGFTPYQSESDITQRQLSLFSRLNLNDQMHLERPLLHENTFDKLSSDLLSMGSKKRRLSQQLRDPSQCGQIAYNCSLLGKSSQNGQLIELQSHYSHDSHKRELSENSCPVIIKNQEISECLPRNDDKPRFAKTKNLLRNLSNYMHKFVLYNRRAQRWVRNYFREKLTKSRRKQSSCRSQAIQKQEEIKEESIQVKLEMEKKEKESMVRQEDVGDSLGEKPFSKMEEDDEIQLQVETEVKQFFAWIGELSIGNFSDYETIWSKPHKFRPLYRLICYRYYRSEAYCDIYRSRLTTKEISVSYLHQFIEGMLDPTQFYRFK